MHRSCTLSVWSLQAVLTEGHGIRQEGLPISAMSIHGSPARPLVTCKHPVGAKVRCTCTHWFHVVDNSQG